MNLTQKEKEKFSFILKTQLEILEKENRIGRCHYDNDDTFKERDKPMLKSAIRMIAEELWNN